MERIAITIDRDLEELMPGFLGNRQKDIEKLKVFYNEADFKGFKHLGHTIKGVGLSYGFEGISAIGADIEKHSVNEDIEALLKDIEYYSQYLVHVDIQYQ